MASAPSYMSNSHPLIFGQPYLYRYVPAMKTKAGEITALENLPNAARDRILPLFHITEQLSASFLSGLVSVWSGRSAAFDGAYNFAQSGSTTTSIASIGYLRAAGVMAIPCWNIADPVAYQVAIASLVDARGAMVKTTLTSIAAVASNLAQLNVSTGLVDLVIVLPHLVSIDPQSFGAYVAYEIGSCSETLAQYRSVTLLGSAAPKDYSALAYGPNIIPRKDWQVWQIVHGQVANRIDYGDFMTAHPDLTEPPGVAMAKATVSARYTRDGDFLMVKGYSTTGPTGQPMGQQYRAHAGTIQATAGFAGVNAWADAQIALAAAGAPKLGSRSKWSAFAANRHISLVVDRLP